MSAFRIQITLECPCGWTHHTWSMYRASRDYGDHIASCPTGRGDPQ